MSIVSTLVSIFRSRTRSLLTMAGIAVGVFSVVLVSTVGTVGASQVSATLVTMGVDTLLVQAADNSVTVTDSAVTLGIICHRIGFTLDFVFIV